MKIFLLLFLAFLSGCTSLATKVEESRLVNEEASTKGFVKSPKEAAKRAQKNCKLESNLKWEMLLNEKSPLLQQNRDNEEPAYGPYAVICFSFDVSGEKQMKVSTKHQGGGYSKAYYVLPALYLFTKEGKSVELTRKFDLKQNPWSGDYHFTIPLQVKAKEIYYLVVESNNRYPTRSWNEYANPGLGWAIQGIFPVKVMSSAYGVVAVEFVSEAK